MINGEYWLTGDAYSTFADGDVGDYNHAMYAFGSAIGLDEDQLRKLYDEGVEADANGINFRAAAKAWIKEKLEPDCHELDWTDPNLLMAIREQDTALDCMKEFVGLFGPDIESHCTDEDVIRSLGTAYLVEAGADQDYLKWYLSDPQGDPRDYAIEHMGWIRVDSDSFQTWKFTDSELSEIRNFDGWPEDDDDGDKLKSSLQEVGIEELSTNKHFSVPLRMLFDEQLSAVEIIRLMENDEALEKYERANKHYEGEEHEHLALNPPKLNAASSNPALNPIKVGDNFIDVNGVKWFIVFMNDIYHIGRHWPDTDTFEWSLALTERDAISKAKIIQKTGKHVGDTMMNPPKFDAAFWKWFGNSVVRNKDGSPKVVYHGTKESKDFMEFKTPSFFSESIDYASEYEYDHYESRIKTGKTRSFFLSIQNPLNLQSLGVKKMFGGDFISALEERGVRGRLQWDDPYPHKCWYFLQYGDFLKHIAGSGFDGVLQSEDYTTPETGYRRARSWVAFHPWQIKSIDNDGTWDADDPNISSNPPELKGQITEEIMLIVNDLGHRVLSQGERKELALQAAEHAREHPRQFLTAMKTLTYDEQQVVRETMERYSANPPAVSLQQVKDYLKKIDTTMDEVWIDMMMGWVSPYPNWRLITVKAKELGGYIDQSDQDEMELVYDYADRWGDGVPPIVIVPSQAKSRKKLKYEIVDGAHRAAAATLLGPDTDIPAYVPVVGGNPDDGLGEA